MNRFTRQRRRILVACGTIFGLVITATVASAQTAATPWADVVAKAKAEGRVNLYHAAVPVQVERLIAAFNKRYPEIKVVATRGTSEMPQRLAAERETKSDGGDAFIFYDAVWFNQNEQYLLELNSPAAAAFPATAWQIKGKTPFVAWVPFGMLVWNTRYVKDGLKDYKDLLKPEYAGRLGVREGRDAVLSGYLDFLEKELGPDYLIALGKQKPKFYPSGVPLVQAVASGEVWVANVGLVAVIKELQEQGAPLGWVVPKPAGFANPWLAGALANSKRPNAARVFIDFTLSREGQQALNGNDSASPMSGVGNLDLSQFRKLEFEKFTPAVVEEWNKKFQQYFPR